MAYGIGAILSFVGLGALLIALRAGGQAIGWGFQLQEPIIVAGFALLMFGVGLNLSGVFEVAGFGGGDSLTRAGGEAGSFFTGVLAVAVAAPCTAPFMAAALGYALTQPAVVALAIFLALGVGFAAPFVLIGISPMLMRALPKPGAWMIRFKQALAFAMYGTAAWLVWVLAQQAGANAVASVLGGDGGGRLRRLGLGRQPRHFSPRGRGIGALVTLIAILAALSCLAFLKSAPAQPSSVNVTGIPSEPYSAARLAALRAENRARLRQRHRRLVHHLPGQRRSGAVGRAREGRIRAAPYRLHRRRLDAARSGDHRAAGGAWPIRRAALSLLCAGGGRAARAAADPDRRRSARRGGAMTR